MTGAARPRFRTSLAPLFRCKVLKPPRYLVPPHERVVTHPPIDVVAGVIRRDDGRLLITQRLRRRHARRLLGISRRQSRSRRRSAGRASPRTHGGTRRRDRDRRGNPPHRPPLSRSRCAALLFRRPHPLRRTAKARSRRSPLGHPRRVDGLPVSRSRPAAAGSARGRVAAAGRSRRVI